MLFKIPNILSQVVTECEPWKSDDHGVPKGITKEEFQNWMKQPGTDASFVSAYSGLNPAIRVTKKHNPATHMHGFIADYDTKLSLGELKDGCLNRSLVGARPAYAHSTISGRGRVIWLFEKPLFLLPKLTKPFIEKLAHEIRATSMFIRLDDQFTNPEQYYHWNPPALKISDETISETLVQSILGQALDDTRAYAGEGEAEIPLDKVWEEVQKLFPGRWNGPFTAGARGCCFWDPTSVNPSAAIVTPSGMVAFSQPKPFYGWGELLGQEFIRQFAEQKFGGPLAGTYFDGKYYWARNAEDRWVPAMHDNAKHDLILNFRLSGCPAVRGALSEADEALTRIRAIRRVDQVFPILYNPKEMVIIDNAKVLNTNRVQACKPHDKPVKWGEGFQWLAKFIDEMFDPPSANQYLLAWLHRFYSGAVDGRLNQGHAIFLAGDTGRGKTLFSNIIVGGLMGGRADASEYLLGETTWNKNLLESPIWTVDDANATTNYDKHTRWTSMIKKSVANTKHVYNVKFHDASAMDWKGRIICSLNDDPESIRQIPHTDVSILDKIMLFKMGPNRPDFPPNDVLEDLIRKELPFFARYVKDFEVPQELVSSNRYGIKPYHHPILLEDSRLMSRANAFSELLDLWIKEYKPAHENETEWIGTSTHLLQDMQNTETLKDLVRPYASSPEHMGRRLAAIASTTGKVRRKTIRGCTKWVIALQLDQDANTTDEPAINTQSFVQESSPTDLKAGAA